MKISLLEETHELVHSMSKTEKRYFNLYTKFQQGNKSYLHLFAVIDKQELFHEKKIIEKLATKMKVVNFPAVTKYLFDQLVASLRSYGAYKDLDSDHSDLIETYKVLQYKGLHGQSGRLLKKIKNITLQDEAFIRHFYVLLLEYLRGMFNTDDSNVNKVKVILQEKRHVLDIIENYTRIGDVFSHQRLWLRSKLYCRNKKEKDELTQLMRPVLDSKEDQMLSLTAMGLRNMGLCDYYMAIGQPEMAFKISKTYLETRKNAGSADKIDTGILSEHGQHLWLAVRSGIFEGFEEQMGKFKTMIDPIRNRQKFIMGYERWYVYSFIYYTRTGQFNNATGFVSAEKTVMSRVGEDFSMKSKIMLWYFTAYYHYALKEYRQAIKYIQQLINHTNDQMEEFSFAKLLLMFIHYDLKNYELLEYQVRSYRRLLQKTERLYKCELLLLEFFNGVAGLPGRRQRKEQLENLQTKINVIFKAAYERGFSFYFDIHAWMVSELTAKDFKQVVRQLKKTS